MAEADALINDTSSPQAATEPAPPSQSDNGVTTAIPVSVSLVPAHSTQTGPSSNAKSAPKATAPVATSNATSTASIASTHTVVDVDNTSQNNTNQLEPHDLPMDEDTSTPRKKRAKLSLDALADWQQALKEKVIDWTTTNFTLVESVDDIVLVDDPSLFVIEEQDGALVNGSLFRRLMRASAANKPLRLAWGVAGLDSVFKVCQAITSKGGYLYWRWLASIANPPQNGKLQKSPQLSTIDWLFFGQSQTIPKSLVWHAPTVQEMDEKDKNAFLDHAVFRWPGKTELQQNTSSTTTRDCACRPVEMYKYIFTETCSKHDCIYDASPYSFAKAFAGISRGFAYRAFFEDEQKLLVVRDQLVQYVLKNIDAEQSTDIVNNLEDTKLVPYSDRETVEEERGRNSDSASRKRKASQSPDRSEESRRHH